MYGLVNKAVVELIQQKLGPEGLLRVRHAANVQTTTFETLKTYPDEITYNMVAQACVLLQVTTESFLEDLGSYWITYTADQGYGSLLMLFGKNFEDCLKNLNEMHMRMGAMMPNFVPPRFKFYKIAENTYEILYFSQRPGLGPFVLGLIRGLGQRFHLATEIQMKVRSQQTEPDIFVVLVQNAA